MVGLNRRYLTPKQAHRGLLQDEDLFEVRAENACGEGSILPEEGESILFDKTLGGLHEGGVGTRVRA